MSTTEHTPQSPDASPSTTLLRLIGGYRITQMIHVAAELGLADLVAGGAKNSAELAARTGMHAPSLYRVLRALSSLGIFSEDEQGRFGLTPLAEPLLSDAPDSLRGLAIFSGDQQVWQPWGEMLHSVQTGETAFGHVFGMDSWEYREQHPDSNAIFNAAMTSLSGRDIPVILAAYDFSSIQTLVDVAGGHGKLIAGILQAHPAMRGMLFDMPHVLAGAAPVLEAAGVADRCQLVSGDFFESVPGGGDAYLLRRILHDWDDERSTAILERCHRAMPEHGKLLVLEGVIQPPNRPDPAKLLDLQMLVGAGGCERTEAEWQTLLAGAGFALTKVYRASAETSIIEGARV